MCLKHICAKVFLLGYIVTLVMVVKAQEYNSPCPEIFKYQVDQSRQLYGSVKIYSFDERVVQLNVQLSVDNYVSNYRGGIELATPKDEVVSKIQQQRRIKYIVHFPHWQYTPPRVTKILVNGQEVCTGSPLQYSRWINVITFVNLQHTFTAAVQPFRYYQHNQNNEYEKNSYLPPSNGIMDIFYPQGYRENTYDDNEFYDTVYTTTTKAPTRRTTTTRSPRPTRSSSNPGVSDNPSETPSSVQSVCGLDSLYYVSPLIVNGQPLPMGSSPWLVAVFISTGTGIEYHCGGSLVSKKHVITAAHCSERLLQNNIRKKIAPEDFLFILGKYSIKNLFLKEGEKMLGAEKIHIHPDYGFGTSDADIAVVVLTEEIQFTNFIRPICIWSETDELDAVVGEKGKVTGWGKDENNRLPSKPRQVTMSIVSQEQCLRSAEIFRFITSERTFCAGDRNLSGPCGGDSGSGFIMKRNNRWFLKGIVSLSTIDQISNFCNLDNYVVFADVSKFRPWLFSIIDI